MTPTGDHATAAELAKRITANLMDPSKADEAGRPPSDRPPAFADALMSETPASAQKDADLSSADWQLVRTALEHYATCGNG